MSWHIDYSILNDILPLEGNTITATYRDMPVEGELTRPLRICQAMGLARRGTIVNINGPSNLCGGDYSCGFEKERRLKDIERAVQERHIYSSMTIARRALILGSGAQVPFNLAKYLILAPLEKTDFNPDLVIFTCIPQQAFNLIRLSEYDNGDARTGIIRTNLCRSGITLPFLTGEIQIGLIDNGGRTYGNFKPEEMIVSMPLNWFLTVLRNHSEIKKLSLSSKI